MPTQPRDPFASPIVRLPADDHEAVEAESRRRREALHALVEVQCGMVARRQLADLGIDAHRVRNQLAAGRWVERSPRVISTITGELTVEQRRWLGVLHAGRRAMLGGLTAASRWGLTGWDRDVVTVLVDDELSFEPVDGVAFFRSRRPYDVLLSPRPGVPCCRLEAAVLLWAGYTAATRPAHAVLAAVVQQRLTTTERLLEETGTLRPLRRSPAFRRTLSFVAGGAHSGAELDVVRMCDEVGLPRPRRQTLVWTPLVAGAGPTRSGTGATAEWCCSRSTGRSTST